MFDLSYLLLKLENVSRMHKHLINFSIIFNLALWQNDFIFLASPFPHPLKRAVKRVLQRAVNRTDTNTGNGAPAHRADG